MTRYEILISFDQRSGPPLGLIVDAHSERGALAQLRQHQARGRLNPNMNVSYATTTGGQVSIPWGQVGNVTIGEVAVATAGTPPAPLTG